MAVRLIEVAKVAEVSPAAVSLALNNKPGVSMEVRQRIIDTAVRLGYKGVLPEQIRVRENINIKLLKIATHGHIVNEHHNAFIAEYLEGIETSAKKLFYTLEVSLFDKVPLEEIVAAQKQGAVDGFIILGTELKAHELNIFSNLPQPKVFIDTYFPLSIYDCIDMDNIDGVFKAIQHLYDNGHRNIGFVKSKYEVRNAKMRETGFHEAMEYFSMPVQEKNIVAVDPTLEGARRDMGKYLQKKTSLPTAFFCCNDMTAYGCIRSLKEYGLKIPEDVSIIGFDDLPSSKLMDPPMTSIRVSTRQIGQRALERLAEKIAGVRDMMPENILISGKLVIRESVKKL